MLLGGTVAWGCHRKAGGRPRGGRDGVGTRDRDREDLAQGVACTWAADLGPRGQRAGCVVCNVHSNGPKGGRSLCGKEDRRPGAGASGT